MNKTQSITFEDFNYKGTNLSDLGWIVAGTDKGIKSYSVLPSMSFTTDRAIGSNVTTVYDAHLEPRPFEVSIFKEDIQDGDIRKLAAWLQAFEDGKFYFVGDDVYCNTRLDSQAFEAEHLGVCSGQIPLKFICHDPYYYSLEPKTQTLTSLKSGQVYTCINSSTAEIFPYIQVACNGAVKIEVYDLNNNLLSTTNITDITAGVRIYTETQDCTLLSGASHFSNIDTFPVFPQYGGDFKVKFTGDALTNATIEYTEKFI